MRLGGLIPARAGKTTDTRSTRARHPAHPRAGGENRQSVVAVIGVSGSSPRGRGKRRGGARRVRPVGLIPARAGKTYSARRAHTRPRAHPRAGGENECVRLSPHMEDGSSPRGRGKRSGRARSRLARRLIPARAGKTPFLTAAITRAQAHPRAGGENPDRASAKVTTSGSSPRGRGKQWGRGTDAAMARLIPARAGKTANETPITERAGAHPRAGGENTF